MIVKRSSENPVLKPLSAHSWEAQAVFNGCPIEKNGKTYLVYRALSQAHYHSLTHTTMMISDIGIAESKDGVRFEKRRRFITPEESWEQFGCEDPRITKLGSKYYIFYTALSQYPFRAEGIKVGVAISKDLKTIQEKHLVTPFNAKGMALFPEKIDGKLWALLTVNTDKPPAKICVASFDKEEDLWSQERWQKWYATFEKSALPLMRDVRDQVEVGAPPIKTKYGWLVLYSYIRGYFSSQKLFSVEAVLLDLKDPLKIIARTQVPILTPEEYYEKIGIVSNVVFPSGAIIKGDWIHLYYGAADTTCCLALVGLSSLVSQMLKKKTETVRLERAKENPIIVPDRRHPWESRATFNPAALRIDNRTHILYRAMSDDNTSVFGYASTLDGTHIDVRLSDPAYVPRGPYEQKTQPGVNSGCEDPRLTRIGNTIYACYTAYDGKNQPRVALTSILVKDFIHQRWQWAPPVLLSPPDISDKDAFVFPEKVGGKFMIVHRVGNAIDFGFSQTLRFKGDAWLEEYSWIGPRKGWWDDEKVGSSAPPIKTKDGWLMLYHGVSSQGVYRVGALLLDLKDPTIVLGRTDDPIFEPEMPYEKTGQVAQVVFPCGNVIIGNTLFVYYGGGDQVVGVATIEIKRLLKYLKSCKC